MGVAKTQAVQRQIENALPGVSSEERFRSLLLLERRRAERSTKPFVLMLLDASTIRHDSAQLPTAEQAYDRLLRRISLLQQALATLKSSTRETDSIGWYRYGLILGVIFTEVGSDEISTIVETLRAKFCGKLVEDLGAESAGNIAVSFHSFPEHYNSSDSGWTVDSTLYPELHRLSPRRKISRFMKRAIDIAGSGTLLFLLLPVLAAIAAIIKLTSKGPVLFQQERIGLFGARFKCLKFRSMYLNNDPQIHQDYVREFISGQVSGQPKDSTEPVVYKITKDPRITTIGRFLRRASLDELPQLWNVLVGEMSLVGPRPPVPYEFEIYELWHRRRVFEVKPGVTGLWQVSGRSSTRFDEMVRLDLRYCTTWSLWLDLKILFATPKVVLFGSGAY
jgi:lipopolysaccharide/colanic/teichoic acid biosynthesis glycosyltransferase